MGIHDSAYIKDGVLRTRQGRANVAHVVTDQDIVDDPTIELREGDSQPIYFDNMARAVGEGYAAYLFQPPAKVKIELITSPGGRPDWNRVTNVIAYDERAAAAPNYYKVLLISPDGSGRTPLNLSNPLFAKHCGGPAWTDDGRWLFFLVQRLDFANNLLADPGIGIGCDGWIWDSMTGNFYKVLDSTVAPYRGFLHLHFEKGLAAGQPQRFVVTAQIGSPSDETSDWTAPSELLIGRLAITGGVPSFTDTQTYQPTTLKQVYEAHQILRNAAGQTILTFMFNGKPGMPSTSFMVGVYNTATGILREVPPEAIADWSEFGEFPGDVMQPGATFIYTTNAQPDIMEYAWGGIPPRRIGELWACTVDANYNLVNHRPLTHMNRIGHANFSQVADLTAAGVGDFSNGRYLFQISDFSSYDENTLAVKIRATDTTDGSQPQHGMFKVTLL